MKTIRISAIAIAAAILLAVSGCVTVETSPELEMLPKSKKVSMEISLLPGLTVEGFENFSSLLKEAVREHDGKCYTYTDQKETADVLVKATGTDTKFLFNQVLLAIKGEIPPGGKEVFRVSFGHYPGIWISPTWPSSVKLTALCIKDILCGGSSFCSKTRK